MRHNQSHIIIIIITVVLIKRGIQVFLRAEQLSASELKKKQRYHRKLAFKIKKKRKELDQKITVRIKNVHVHGFSNQCHR